MKTRNPILTGWEVETCTELPLDENGELQHDAAVYRKFEFSSKDDAMKTANRLLPNDQWHSVRVTEFVRFRPDPAIQYWHKEYVSDPEYVEAP